MEARLKSISRTIHWSLAAKAFVFGLSWFLLPYWLFFFVALVLYFFPLFRPFRYFFPFLVTLFFTLTLSYNLLAALLFAILFYLILGIKDLVIVNRFLAYQTLAILLIFLSFLNFFSRFDGPNGPSLLFWSLIISLAYAVFLKNIVQLNLPEGDWNNKRKILIFGLSGFLIWQWTFAVLFLPLNVFYQTAVMFLVSAVLAEIIMDYSVNNLTKRRLLTYFSIAFAFIVIVLTATTWTI